MEAQVLVLQPEYAAEEDELRFGLDELKLKEQVIGKNREQMSLRRGGVRTAKANNAMSGEHPMKKHARVRSDRSQPKKAAKTKAKRSGAKKRGRAGQRWNLRLYVAGQTPKSLTAFENLKKICEEYLAGRYSIEVIDLLKNPQLARSDQILAIPTLVRKLPPPIKKIIGDLSDRERVIVGLDMQRAK